VNLETLAVKVIETLESSGVEFMLVGALAGGAYGVPRSTRDVRRHYVQEWCVQHATEERLRAVLPEIARL
jgi:hypothetical protein